jgi:hypothetical protein
MRRQLSAVWLSLALMAVSGATMAHHSFAMFDTEHPIAVEGKVLEFKFTSPHTFIFLEIMAPDGTATVWNLEGGAPSGLVRDGWTSSSIKPGDELKITIHPLRSGAPGGSWEPRQAKFKDGRAVVSH